MKRAVMVVVLLWSGVAAGEAPEPFRCSGHVAATSPAWITDAILAAAQIQDDVASMTALDGVVANLKAHLNPVAAAADKVRHHIHRQGDANAYVRCVADGMWPEMRAPRFTLPVRHLKTWLGRP